MLRQDIEAGEGTFLIAERTLDPTGHTYARACVATTAATPSSTVKATPGTTTAPSPRHAGRPPTAHRLGVSSCPARSARNLVPCPVS